MKNLSAKEVAKKLGIGESTLYQKIREGKFPKAKSNGISKYWRVEVIEAWTVLAEGTDATLPAIPVCDLREVIACIQENKMDCDVDLSMLS